MGAATRPSTADGGQGTSGLACRGLQEEVLLMDTVHTGHKGQKGVYLQPFTCVLYTGAQCGYQTVLSGMESTARSLSHCRR